MDIERIHENNIEKLVENIGEVYPKVKSIYNIFRDKFEGNSKVKEFVPILCYKSTAEYYTNNKK